MSIFDQMSLPEAYERFLVEPLFQPFAKQLLDRLNVSRDDSVLDVACGSGVVGRILRRTFGTDMRIVGVDASPAMLAVARRVEPTIEWREGNAAALPVSSDERFSRVSCHQGLQFFQDRAAAVREMHRVLIPGGRVAVATWGSIHDTPFAADLHRVAEQHLGATNDVRHSMGDGESVARLLRDGGFHDVVGERVSDIVRGIDGAIYARLNAMAIVGMNAKARTLSDEERAALTERVASDSLAVIQRFVTNNVLEFELATNIATGRA